MRGLSLCPPAEPLGARGNLEATRRVVRVRMWPHGLESRALRARLFTQAIPPYGHRRRIRHVRGGRERGFVRNGKSRSARGKSSKTLVDC